MHLPPLSQPQIPSWWAEGMSEQAGMGTYWLAVLVGTQLVPQPATTLALPVPWPCFPSLPGLHLASPHLLSLPGPAWEFLCGESCRLHQRKDPQTPDQIRLLISGDVFLSFFLTNLFGERTVLYSVWKNTTYHRGNGEGGGEVSIKKCLHTCAIVLYLVLTQYDCKLFINALIVTIVCWLPLWSA